MAVDPVAVAVGFSCPRASRLDFKFLYWEGHPSQLATPIYMPFRPFGRGPTNPVMGLTNYSQIIVANYLLTTMILKGSP